MIGGDGGLAQSSYVKTDRSGRNMSRVHNALRRLEQTGAVPLSGTGLESEHWLLPFLEELLSQFRTSGEISFEAVQGLLQQHEQDFFKDLETARRMYRTYPHLFQDENADLSAQSKAARA